MKRYFSGFILTLFIFSCQSVPKKMEPVKNEPDKVLADIVKIDVPVIEKKTRMVKVNVEALRPSFQHTQEEVEIKKSDTGYEIRLWLMRSSENSESLSFKKEITFKIPVSGGHDIEIVGKNKKWIELIFIDEHE